MHLPVFPVSHRAAPDPRRADRCRRKADRRLHPQGCRRQKEGRRRRAGPAAPLAGRGRHPVLQRLALPGSAGTAVQQAQRPGQVHSGTLSGAGSGFHRSEPHPHRFRREHGRRSGSRLSGRAGQRHLRLFSGRRRSRRKRSLCSPSVRSELPAVFLPVEPARSAVRRIPRGRGRRLPPGGRCPGRPCPFPGRPLQHRHAPAHGGRPSCVGTEQQRHHSAASG